MCYVGTSSIPAVSLLLAVLTIPIFGSEVQIYVEEVLYIIIGIGKSISVHSELYRIPNYDLYSSIMNMIFPYCRSGMFVGPGLLPSSL